MSLTIPWYDLDAALAEPADLDIEAVKAFASALTADIAAELLGAPNRKMSNRRELRFGRHGSMTIDIRPGRAGRWFDHEQGVGGDLIGLVQRELGGDFRTALNWLAGRVGIGNMTPDDMSALIADRAALSAAQAVQEERERAERIQMAAEVWRASVPPAGTPVEAYLRNRRCWHPWLATGDAIRWNPNTPMSGGRFPCMIAAMSSAATGEWAGIHRTHVTPDGLKGLAGKKMLGSAMGSIIRLRWHPLGQIGAIGEGIENTLSAVALHEREYPIVCAAMSAGNLKTLEPFAPVNLWSIYADRDAVGTDAAIHFAARCEVIRVNREVFLPGAGYADFNDHAMNKKIPGA